MTATAQKAEITFGGKYLIFDNPIRWSLTAGVQPHTEIFQMAPSDARTLAVGGGPYDLIITPPQGNPVKVTNLWVLNIQPGSNPYISEITVADRRWMWSYGHILRRYNMRRNVGTKRLLASDKTPEINATAPDIAYWRWSLKSAKTRWVAFTVLEDIMKAVANIEKKFTGSTFTTLIDNRIGKSIQGFPIENFEIDDAGDMAIQRALNLFGEASITVDYDGTVIAFSRAGGDEEQLVKALMPEIRGQGHTDLVKNSLIRPREIHVLFTREVELRFNFIETAAAIGATTTSDPLGDRREMENVLPIPDYQLVVSEIAAQALAQGTYITVDQAFRSWGSLPLVGITRSLDHDMIQRAFVPHNDLWATLTLAGQRPDAKGNLSNWVGRIAAVQGHYRRTFRLNSKWMDRILSIRPFRLGTIDPQSGQRGPAMAYSDYAVMYTQRSIWRNNAQGQPLDFCINKTGYAATIDSTAVPSPSIVSIPDHDQGILHVDYLLDPNRAYEMILPSQIVEGSMPTADITQKTRNITFDSIINGVNVPRLSPSFRLAVLLTAIPASPNTSQQLHKIVIRPNDIADLLPQSQRTGLNDAQGPIMEIRVGPNIETARVVWKDDRSTDIEKVFGLTDGEPNLSDLVLNEGTTKDLASGASLNAIAKARAAAVYASLTDRYEGDMTAYMNGGVHLNGWVDAITHEATPKGETYTHLSMPSKVPQMNLLAFLSSNDRAAILHLAKPEGK